MYPLVMTNSLLLNMFHCFFSFFPIKNGWSFHSYVTNCQRVHDVATWDHEPVSGKIIHSCSKPPTRYVQYYTYIYIYTYQLEPVSPQFIISPYPHHPHKFHHNILHTWHIHNISQHFLICTSHLTISSHKFHHICSSHFITVYHHMFI